jgi:ribose transport system permease protein
MRKHWGLLGIFAVVCIVTALYGKNFLTAYNLMNLVQRTALFSILALGVGFVIGTGGIDLSLGSVVCLVGIAVPWLLIEHGWSPWTVVPVVLAGSALANGAGTAALFNGPMGVAVGPYGALYVAEQTNNRVRVLVPP